MSHDSGGLLILAAECQPSEALAAAARWIPRAWHVAARPAPWGTAVIAGSAVFHEDDLVMIGTAVADPWGTPEDPIDRHVLLERYARYGSGVAQLAAGPFAVADLGRGSLVPALNGIVPLFVGRGPRVAVGCHPELVAALAGGAPPLRAPMGCWASVTGAVSTAARLPASESLPLTSLAGLEAEIELRIQRAGQPRPVRRGPFCDRSGRLRVRRLGEALVATPGRGSLRRAPHPLAALEGVRSRISTLWWQAGLRSTAVFAPALERPVLDALSYTGKAG